MEDNLEQPQVEVPQQETPKTGDLDKLYNVVNQTGLYTKTKDEFVKKYNNPESIDKLYSIVNQTGLYTKSKDDFYNKYYPDLTQQKTQGLKTYGQSTQQPQEVKRPDFGSDLTSATLNMSQKAKDSEMSYKPQPIKKQPLPKNVAENTQSGLALPTTIQGGNGIPNEQVQNTDLQEKLAKRAEDRNIAVNNYLDKKGLKPNTAQRRDAEENLTNAIQNDDFVVAKSKDGELKLFRTQGYGETLFNTVKNSAIESVDAVKENSASDSDLLNIYKQKDAEAQQEDETKPKNDIRGYLSELAGGAVKPLTLQSLNAIVPSLGNAAMVGEAYNTALAKQRYQLYREGIQNKLSPKDALAKAKQTAQYTALGDAAIAAVLAHGTGEVANTIKNGSVEAAEKTFKQSLIDGAKSAAKVGGYMGASEVAKTGVEAAGGYDRTVVQGLENGLKGLGSGAMMDVAFKAITHAALNPFGVIKGTVAAAKNLFTEAPKEMQDAYIETLPDDVAKKVKESVGNFSKAKDDIKDFVPEEHLASFAGKLEKAKGLEQRIRDLELRKVGKPQFAQDQIDLEIQDTQKEIDGINKQVNDAAKEGKAPTEKDDVTGLKQGQEPQLEETKQNETIPSEQSQEQAPEILNPTEVEKPITEKVDETKPTTEETKGEGEIKSNWNYEGEGDAFASNPKSREGKSAYVIRVLDSMGHGKSYNRAEQRGELDTESPLKYVGDKETVSAIDGNGNKVGVVKLQSDGGIEHLAVAPEFTKKGVATELIKQIKQNGADVNFEKSKKISPDAAKLFNKLNEQPKETIPNKETVEGVVEPNKQIKINDLVDRVQQLQKLRANDPKRSKEVNDVKLAAKELGLEYKDDFGKLFNDKGTEIQKREPITNKTVVKDFDRKKYSKETNDSIDFIVDNEHGITWFDIRGTDGKRLSAKQRADALQSIKDGKPNYAAKAVFDFIEQAHEKGGIELEDVTSGKRDIVPIEKYFDAIKTEEDKLAKANAEDFENNKELEQSDEYINQLINDYEQENSKQNNESKPTSEAEVIKETSTGTSPKENGQENAKLEIPKEVKNKIKDVVVNNTELPSKLSEEDYKSLSVKGKKEYKIASGEEKIFKKLIECIWD